MHDPLLRWRERFPILQHTNYLISNSLGAMPRATAGALEEYAHSWASRGVRAWAESWWELPGRFGARLATLLGVPAESVSLHANVTLATAVVLSCFEPDPKRDKIVYTDMNFPSIHYLHQRFAPNARIELVASDDGVGVPTERLLDAIDERTLLVPISHVLFRSAWIQDVEAVVEKAQRVGAHVVLDTYQSVGVLPVDLARLGVDFAVGGTLKWLCGGPGVAFLYVRPDLAPRLEPRLTGWMAHPEPFAFEMADMRYTAGPYRFQNGTPNIPGLYAAREGLEIILEVGPEAIRDKSRHQTARLVELARARGFRVTAPEDPERRGGTVAIDVTEGYAVSRELLAREVIVDYRPKAGIRLSPHFYTSDQELEDAVEAIHDIIETRAFEKHLGQRGTVT